ncbi:putative bifunctional diguanylate cyclase/phosphodiesterase [Pseudoalteromonas distincta]|uniref:putative bifunctional diguanylate cyclase/phosphodiesterase n=1 Tax=Pseudoalteromonas distincta TaxID=77608 RepID=UPI0032E25119
MGNIFVYMIVLGGGLLTLSILPTIQICRKTNRVFWVLLLVLIIGFILGYGWILYYFLNSSIGHFVENSVSLILFGGGAFVYLVMKLSLKSIIKIEHYAEHQRFLAEHDYLTNLPNRKKFFQTLNKHVKYSAPFALLLIDLNNFKKINDLYGNKLGDILLNIFAKTMNKNLGGIAKLYRIGGDEFALLVETLSIDSFETCMNAINKSIKSPFAIYEHNLRIKLTMGASFYLKDSVHPNELFTQANLALQEAKRIQQPYVAYQKELGKRANDLRDMSSKIKCAINEQEFELYLQPIFEADSEDMHGAEVLIRWPQSDGSFVSPDLFIGIAEQSGLILGISKWVVLETINHLKKLKTAGFIGALHVNLSTKDLESPEFYEFIDELLTADPSLSDFIMFEITERAMMTNLEAAQGMMQKLNSRGFEFSIDDFGTGFSSLVLLRELPISQIKIDQSFVKDMLTQITDYAIVESTLFLASRLNCKVVAEGIENQDVQQTLTSMNCDYLQGYYYSKPININEFINIYMNEEKYRII